MKFTPLTEEQLQRHLAEGPAQFEIMKALEGESKKGDPMYTIDLRVWDKNGKQGLLTDYLLMTIEMGWKFKNLLDAIDRGGAYLTGEISAESLIGASGLARLYLQKSKDPKYKDKIAVADYLISENGPVPVPSKQEEDTPF